MCLENGIFGNFGADAPFRLEGLVFGYPVTVNPPSALEPRCSWCHKPQDAVAILIASPTEYPRAYICDQYVAVCTSIIADEEGRITRQSTQPGYVPKDPIP
jgi:hypothetical protein